MGQVLKSVTVSREAEYNENEKVAAHLLSTKKDDTGEESTKVYAHRWLMLALFSLFSISNAYQWIHLNIIGNIMLRFYNESLPENTLQRETAVDWLSLIFMGAYVPFIFPGMWLLDKKGLRVNNIIGSFINAVGAWLKCACVNPNRFPVLMVAQLLCAIAGVFVVGIPPRLSAIWFGPNQVSTATSIGVFGNQVGVAIGFVIPPYIVPNSSSLDEIGKYLGIMYYSGAALCSALFLAILIGFRNQPPSPPSRAQLLINSASTEHHYLLSLKHLFHNPSFVLIMISYGLITGAYYAVSILLNPIILHYFKDEEENAGKIGLTIILTGILGAIIAGVWLDRTKRFKSTSVAIYFLSWAGMVGFTLTIYLDLGQIWIIFCTSGILGFFMTGYLPVGYEFAAEITYPLSEGTSSGLLTASAMFFGIVLTLGMRTMMNQVSILAANTFLTGVLLLGAVMTALVKPDYGRQEAEKAIRKQLDNLEVIVPAKDERDQESSSN